jgi:RecB family exonuclease
MTYGTLLHRLCEGKPVSDDEVAALGFSAVQSFDTHRKLFSDVANELQFTDDDSTEYRIETLLKDPLSGETWEVPFVGIIDRLLSFRTPDGELHARGFIDYKTSSQSWSDKKTEEDEQFTFYTLAFQSAFGIMQDAYLVNFMKAGKNRQVPTVQVKSIERTKEQCSQVLAEARALYESLVVNEECERVCRGSFFCPPFVTA